MSTNTYKTGRWSNEELETLQGYVEQGLSYFEISIKLNRNPDNIKKTAETVLKLNLPEEIQNIIVAENNIKTSPEWLQISMQFNQEELDLFLHHWRAMVAQFNNDVTHTEKLQIIDICRIEILENRIFKKMHDSANRLMDLRTKYENALNEDPPDQQTANSMLAQIGAVETANTALVKECKDLLDKKQEALKEVKGTRALRIKHIQESKDTLQSSIASLVAEPQRRIMLGREAEKHRIAKEVEYVRLSDYYQYADGVIDQPILNSETLKDDNI